ncbi:hypothetical protein FPQ18DRAFT_394365 [Pyronema domesticum]|nr:hypothetical protein FPQ18DRAFT_394365 [Pyronema domesticum]
MASPKSSPSANKTPIDHDYYGIEQQITADFEKIASDINEHVLEQLSKFRSNLCQVLQAKDVNEKKLRDENDELKKELAENKQQFEINDFIQRTMQEKIDKLWRRDEVFRATIIELMLANEKLQDMKLKDGMKYTDLIRIDEVLQEELNEWLKVHEKNVQEGVEKWMDENIKNIQSKMDLLRDNFTPMIKVTEAEQDLPQYSLKEPINQRDMTLNPSEIVQQLQQLNQKSTTETKSTKSEISKGRTAATTKSGDSDEKLTSANSPIEATTSKVAVTEKTFQQTKEEPKQKNAAIKPQLSPNNGNNVKRMSSFYDERQKDLSNAILEPQRRAGTPTRAKGEYLKLSVKIAPKTTEFNLKMRKNDAESVHSGMGSSVRSKITELFDSVLPEVADEFGAFCRKTPLKTMPSGRVMVENLAGTDVAARYAYVRWEKVRQFEDLQRLMMCIWGQGLGPEPQIFYNDEPKGKKDWMKLSGKMANITLCPDETLAEDDPKYWKIQCFDTTA